VKAWLQWCRAQRDRVTVVEADVPDCVLPAGVKASLSDIKVGGGKKRFGPDDAIYNKYVRIFPCLGTNARTLTLVLY
jgi:hypothetical protein